MDYRSQFSKLKRLASFPVMKIFLSATIPPILEHMFLEETCLPSSTKWIRASTTRPNLRYHVFQVDNHVKHVQKVAANLANYLQDTHFNTNTRGIIFCINIETVEKLGSLLGSSISHSKMDHSVRITQQNMWFEGTSKWMVASPGFLHGIDHPGVDAVIFVGIPYGLINIEQGSGRAGRAGQEANIFLLNNPYEYWLDDGRPETDPECRQAATLFTRNSTDCRRYQMTKFMNGTGLICGEVDGALLCDVCKPTSELINVVLKFMEPEPSPPASPGRDTLVLENPQDILDQVETDHVNQEDTLSEDFFDEFDKFCSNGICKHFINNNNICLS